jgi:hypothetical protein
MRTIYNTIKAVICAIALLPMTLVDFLITVLTVIKAVVVRGVSVVERAAVAVVQVIRYIVCLPLNAVIYVLTAVVNSWARFSTIWGFGLPKWAANAVIEKAAKAEQAPTDVTLEDDAISDDAQACIDDIDRALDRDEHASEVDSAKHDIAEALKYRVELEALDLSKLCENSYLADRRGATKQRCSKCRQPGHNIRNCK